MIKIDRENPNTEEYWNEIAIKDGFLTNLKVDKSFIGNIIKKEIEGSSIDVGAGSGMITKYLSVDSACDFSQPAVEQLKLLTDDAFWCDLLKGINKPDNSFDTVIATEILEHFDEPEKIVKELARVAKNKIIITVPNKENGLKSREHVWLFNVSDIHDMFGKYGKTSTVVINETIIGICTLT